MIATARQLADPRARAKARLRAAARPPRKHAASQAGATPGQKATTFMLAHPAAAAATLLALSALFGPVRLVRLGLAAVRTVSMATGVVKFVGTLPPTAKAPR